MAEQQDKLRILLLGHTGAGKSSTGNTIAGEKHFDSFTGTESKTSDCIERETSWSIDGRQVVISDTPGFCDTKREEKNVEQQILHHLNIYKAHVFLLVISLKGRFPEEEGKTLDRMETLFGSEIYRHSVVVLTGQDYLRGTTLDSFMGSQAHPKVKQLVQRCGDRVVALNNNAIGQEREDQLRKLEQEIKKIGSFEEYTGCADEVSYSDVFKEKASNVSATITSFKHKCCQFWCLDEQTSSPNKRSRKPIFCVLTLVIAGLGVLGIRYGCKSVLVLLHIVLNTPLDSFNYPPILG